MDITDTYMRYRKLNISDAIELALKDLREAPDSQPRDPCKMHAADLFVRVTSERPDLISNDIIDTCQQIFPKCNQATQIQIIRIMGLLRRQECLDFLISIAKETDRPNSAYGGKNEDGKSVMIHVRKESQPDWVSDAAEEAIRVIKGELDITPSNQWIYKRISKNASSESKH
jgi:hypothetical protein